MLRYDNSFYMMNPFKDKKICVFVPHEDDEMLTMGAILPYLASNTHVYVVITTNGDYLGKNSGMKRIEESRKVLISLGVKKNNIIFLGFSDQATSYNGKSIYEANENEVCCGTGEVDKTYGIESEWNVENKKITYGRCMTRKNLYYDIRTILCTLLPDFVFSIGLDGHVDHDGLSEVIDNILVNMRKENYSPIVYKMLAHSTYWLGKYDYSSWNNNSTVIDKNILRCLYQKSPIYHWEDRVRFPISKEFIGFPSGYKYYKLLKEYKTQKAEYCFARALNSDLVFFQVKKKIKNKCTDSKIVMIKLLYKNNFIYDYYTSRNIEFVDFKVYLLHADGECEYVYLDDNRLDVFFNNKKINFVDNKKIEVKKDGYNVIVQLKHDSLVFDRCRINLYGVKEIILKKIEQFILCIIRVMHKGKRKVHRILFR